MPLISSNPKSTEMLIADYAKATDQYVMVIDNSKYHTLATDKKATVLAYYDGIIPEAEIDRIFELEHIYYYFNTEEQAESNCFNWFPQPQNVPDADHWIKAYVIRPNGTIPYVNEDPTNPG
tara:strand:- start:974 stop:1336 length:363 start_codon:yes stop_codon:yes gene_type:complete